MLSRVEFFSTFKFFAIFAARTSKFSFFNHRDLENVYFLNKLQITSFYLKKKCRKEHSKSNLVSQGPSQCT